jgi:hypothetical protein
MVVIKESATKYNTKQFVVEMNFSSTLDKNKLLKIGINE